MKLKPLGLHVLIKPIKEEQTIIIPGGSQEQAERGIVLGIGSGVELDLKEDQEVIFKKYSPEEFEMDGEKVYLIEEADLMGVWLNE